MAKKTTFVWAVVVAIVVIGGLAAAYFSNPALFTGDIASSRAKKDCEKLQEKWQIAEGEKKADLAEEYARRGCKAILGEGVAGFQAEDPALVETGPAKSSTNPARVPSRSHYKVPAR